MSWNKVRGPRDRSHTSRLDSYALISNPVEGVCQHQPKKKDLYVDIYRNNPNQSYSATIICSTYSGNKKFYVDVNHINKYNVYIFSIEILEKAYDEARIKSFRHDLNYMDKLVAVHFNNMKVMNVMCDYMDKITHDLNYDIILEQLESGSTELMDCFYQFRIQSLKPQLANFSLRRDKLQKLLEY
jgi:hypothetical protein